MPDHPLRPLAPAYGVVLITAAAPSAGHRAPGPGRLTHPLAEIRAAAFLEVGVARETDHRRVPGYA